MDQPSVCDEFARRLDLAGPAPCEDYDRDGNAWVDVGAIGWIVRLLRHCCLSCFTTSASARGERRKTKICQGVTYPESCITKYTTYTKSSHPWSAVERMWHMEGSQGQILALAFWSKSSRPFEIFPFRSAAVPSLVRFCLARVQPRVSLSCASSLCRLYMGTSLIR